MNAACPAQNYATGQERRRIRVQLATTSSCCAVRTSGNRSSMFCGKPRCACPPCRRGTQRGVVRCPTNVNLLSSCSSTGLLQHDSRRSYDPHACEEIVQRHVYVAIIAWKICERPRGWGQVHLALQTRATDAMLRRPSAADKDDEFIWNRTMGDRCMAHEWASPWRPCGALPRHRSKLDQVSRKLAIAIMDGNARNNVPKGNDAP